MKRLSFFIILFSIFACSEKQESKFSLIDHIPASTEIIIRTADLNTFMESLENNSFLSETEFSLQKKVSNQLQFIKHLNFNSETGINLSGLSSENLIYTITTKKDSNLIVFDSIQNKSVESFDEDGVEFRKISLDDHTFFLYENSGTSILSNSKIKILDIARKENIMRSPGLKNAFDAADPNKTSVFIKDTGFKTFSVSFEQFGFPGFQDFAEWTVLDVDITNSEISLNGIAITTEQQDFLSNFSGLDPRQSEIGKICPEDFLSFYSFSMSPLKQLEKNLQNYSRDSTAGKLPKILTNIREAASIKLKNGELFVLNANEIESAKESLAGLGKEIENYRNIPIHQLETSGVFQDLLSPVISTSEDRFYGIIDHFIIFSNEIAPIKKMIADFQNSNTISTKAYYSELMSSLSSESSLLFVTRMPEFYTRVSENSEKTSNLKKNSLGAFQIIREDNFAHIHGRITNSATQEATSNGAQQISSFKLDAPTALKPYFFKNHESDQMDIAVQDENNTVYLISNKGTTFWKKKLDSQITSPIFEVDLFKNGNKQLAFSTGYHLEVLDRNGNTVKPFPVKFNEPLTQPLSVFDYDNNRTYRFVLTQDKKVYMLGPKGKSIKGFDFEEAKTTVVKTPKHIRLGNKDYILIAEESGRLNILSRQGSIRVPVNENFKYSENEWYGHDAKFITSSEDSNLISVTQSGAVSRKNLEFADNHRIVANDNFLVYLNENILSINNKEVVLDFGLYTDPQIFKIGKKTFISITDIQAQKVYVFNENAELISGFPVYGTSQVDIANTNVDAGLELIVRGDEDEILLYKL